MQHPDREKNIFTRALIDFFGLDLVVNLPRSNINSDLQTDQIAWQLANHFEPDL